MKTNRLANEKSPYLLQHKYNPVDWYPWGKEAFEKAKAEDKPIFLSIGYSTCHWCHVMEKESFEDQEVAELLNQSFVSIKVDREERPDVDNIYMTVCQMLTGSGGWPLTIIMTPDKKPFFAGTYFPKAGKFGRPGMTDLIPRIDNIWKTRRSEVLSSADNISNALKMPQKASSKDLTPDIFDAGFSQFESRFDKTFGGFNTAPKFPTPHNFFFLLRYWKRSKNDFALEMVEKTLQEMRRGGIFDHIGFGFHRYSTDEKWLVPHFEKMLYDQALLTIAYTETYLATGNNLYKKTAEEILTYVLRDMTSPEGGFYSAEDADSEGEEGRFYLWSLYEINSLLGNNAEFLNNISNISMEGNWIDPVHGGVTDTNIIHLKKSKDEILSDLNLSENEFDKKFEEIRTIIFKEREKRIHPHKDDKILTDWNGLMISAFCKAAQAFDEIIYADAAKKAAEFILKNLRDKNGRLLHRYRDGEGGINANLDDYAFFIAALLDLYETTFETVYLEKAIELNKHLEEYFSDKENGGYFFTADDAEELIVRQKEFYDGAIPSGNSVQFLNLMRLSRFTGKTGYEDSAMKMSRSFSENIRSAPSGFTQFLTGLDFAFGPAFEIVLAGEKNSDDTHDKLSLIRKKFIPNKIVIAKSSNDKIEKLASFTEGMKPENGNTSVYICENFSCRLPVTDVKELEPKLKEIQKAP